MPNHRPIEQGKKRGFGNTSLVAMHEKKGLISFYESLGFKITLSAPIVEHAGIRATIAFHFTNLKRGNTQC